MLANLSGSPITVGRAEDRKLLARSASARCLAAYVYAAAGEGESSTDLAWDGQTMIYENGVLLAESERFPKGAARSVADVDTELLRAERLRIGHLRRQPPHLRHRRHGLAAAPGRRSRWTRRTVTSACAANIERFPFVPSDPARLQQDCYEAYNIQVSGLEQRLRALNYPKVVIGVSGGLDSTHALIVAARAMDREGRPRSDILAFTLPGFATGERTKGNAIALGKALGVTFEEIDIRDTATLMLTEMDHPFARGEKVYDVTFENVQAGLRTDYLFRLANQRGGIVLGTGDLSELALGWSTYGVGDQMSHYNVNGGVPKTLIQHLIRWVISSGQFEDDGRRGAAVGAGHRDHPELVPTGEDEQMQSSEAKVGPYALQDFSLYHVLRYGFRPSKIAFLAWHAWRDAEHGHWPLGYPLDKRPSYSLKDIRHWLQVFVQRFYSFSPVQAVGPAERAQGVLGRGAVAAWGLARAVGHVGADLARRDRA